MEGSMEPNEPKSSEVNPPATPAAVPRRRRFPLLLKISLLVGVTLALFAGVVASVESTYFSDVLHREAMGRGKAISATIAAALVEMPDSAIG